MKEILFPTMRVTVAASVIATLCTSSVCSPTLDAIRSGASSPTLDAIRITRPRDPAPDTGRVAGPAVIPVQVSRHRGRIRSVVRVVARDPRVAALEARIAALRQSIQEQVGARRADQASRRTLAARVEALSRLLASRQDELDRLGVKLTESGPERKPDGTFEVSVTAEAPVEALQSYALAHGASSRSLVLRMEDQVDGQHQADHLVETMVASRLLDHGMNVYCAEAPDPPAAPQGPSVNAQPVDREFAAEYLAQWVTDVTVRTEYAQDNDGIVSYDSRASIRVVNMRSSEIGAAIETKTVRGFGLGKLQAAEKARRAVAEEIASELQPRIERSPPSRVALSVPEDDRHLTADLQRVLTGVEGFKVVRVQEETGGARLIVDSQAGAAGLLAFLEKAMPQIRLGGPSATN